MLTLKEILEIWKKDCGVPLPVVLDRFDNTDHRRSYNRFPINYQSKPIGKNVRTILDYDTDGTDVRIVQR